MPQPKPCRTALVSLNAKYAHSSLAVWCLSAAVSRFSRAKHDVCIVEGTINQPDSAVLEQIINAAPDVVGFSVYIWNALKVETLLREVKAALPGAAIIIGGPEASFNAAHWLSLGADFVVIGEGERLFAHALDTIAAGEPLPEIIGPAPAANDETDPYTDEYFRALRGRIAYLETSRGCPFECSFCLSGGSNVRFFSLEKAKEQLYRLSRSGTRTVKLVDRTFNCNADRAYELFEYIIALETDCCFHFEIAADLLNTRTISLLKSAPPGRIQLEAGLQSFNQPTLDAVARRTSLDLATQNLRELLRAANIHIHIDLIAGLPLETPALFARSFNSAYAIGAHTLQLGFLKLLHGSRLRAQAEEMGIIFSSEPPYEVESTPWISASELSEIRRVEHALETVHNSGRFTETARYALERSALSPYELYSALGKTIAGHGAPVEQNAHRIYKCLSKLKGIAQADLCDKMICDWLCSMRGKNMPDSLRTGAVTHAAYEHAQRFLGRKIERSECAVLHSGDAIFIDSARKDPVTGRYMLHHVPRNA